MSANATVYSQVGKLSDFTSFYLKYEGVARQEAKRLTRIYQALSPNDTDDIVTESMMKIWVSYSKPNASNVYIHVSDVKDVGLVRRIVRNAAIDCMRRDDKGLRYSRSLDEPIFSDDDSSLTWLDQLPASDDVSGEVIAKDAVEDILQKKIKSTNAVGIVNVAKYLLGGCSPKDHDASYNDNYIRVTTYNLKQLIVGRLCDDEESRA